MPLSQYPGDPTKFPPTIGIIDDAVQRTAANLNVEAEGLADRTAFLGARLLPSQGVDWQPAIGTVPGLGGMSGAGNSDSNGAVLWDEVNGVWLVSYTFPPGFVTLGGLYAQDGFDPAAAFIAPWGGPAYQIAGGCATSLAQDPALPTTYFAALVFFGTTQSYVAKLDTTSGTPAWASSIAQADASVADIQLLSFGNSVFAGVNGSAAFSHILQTVDHGATWTTPVDAGAVYTGGCSPWIIKASPLQVVALAGSTFYWTLDAGVWTTRNFGVLLSALGLLPVGLAWGSDAIGPCWLLAAAHPYPIFNQTEFYRSGDGINWTHVSSTSTAPIRDLAAVGPLFVATTADQGVVTPFGGIGASYVVVSIDGGVTWRRSQGCLTQNLPVVSHRYRSSRLASNGRQFCLYNSDQVRFSRVVGSSPVLWT